MSISLRGIRVFIATPGGLEDERASFRTLMTEYNEDEGFDQGVTLIPVGWELARPGIGRPQEKINEDVRQCDYVVLVLGDRWGSPPSVGGAYTSGTEEEYNVARQCIANAEMPMRDILVLFKGVDPKQLSDPGPQLQRVLAFKKKLESEKTLLFQTYDSSDEFKRHLRRQLQVWSRDHHKKAVPAAPLPDPNEDQPTVTSVEDGADGLNLVEMADQLTKEGRLVEAESHYARAVVGRRDLDALTKYVRFLRRTGRLDQAVALSNRLLELATEQNSWTSQIEALSNMAIIKRKMGDLKGSTRDLTRATAVAESVGEDGLKDLGFLYDNLGLTERKAGRFDQALRWHQKAIEVREVIDDPRGMANSLNHAGALLRQAGRYPEAEEMHRRVLEDFEEQNYERGITQAMANLAEDLVLLGRSGEAEALYKQALAINERLKSPEGIGMNLWQLGRLALKNGQIEVAERYAFDAVAADDSSGRPEGLAGAYHLMGQVQIAQEDYNEALRSLDDAHASYMRGNHPLGAAWTMVDLARALFLNGNQDVAREALAEAIGKGGVLGHAEFELALEDARRLISTTSN